MDFKSTDELIHEIKYSTDVEDYLKKNEKHLLNQHLSEHLNMLLSEKGLRRADVVRNSLLDRVYVYQIFSGKKTPSRDKLIALAFGLCLSIEETQKMLKLSGNRELYARDARDALILFALQHKKTIFEVNELLFSHNFTPPWDIIHDSCIPQPQSSNPSPMYFILHYYGNNLLSHYSTIIPSNAPNKYINP